MTDYWMKLPFLLNVEMAQLAQEGCDVSGYTAEVAGLTEDTPREELLALYDRLSQLRPNPDFPYVEPSDLDGIRQERAHSRESTVPHLP